MAFLLNGGDKMKIVVYKAPNFLRKFLKFIFKI